MDAGVDLLNDEIVVVGVDVLQFETMVDSVDLIVLEIVSVRVSSGGRSFGSPCFSSRTRVVSE